ncbi:MAG TPA: metalloregulator ArsR/SmtB family transcription factor [Bacillota bacterium]|jgi:DNA-binding transcriptional ArsR family regulator
MASDDDDRLEECFDECFDGKKVEMLRPELQSVEGLADIFKALADDTRVRIVYALSREELCVHDLAALLGSSVSAVSHHLRLLRQMHLVRHHRQGKRIFYTLDDLHVVGLLHQSLDHLEHTRR